MAQESTYFVDSRFPPPVSSPAASMQKRSSLVGKREGGDKRNRKVLDKYSQPSVDKQPYNNKPEQLSNK